MHRSLPLALLFGCSLSSHRLETAHWRVRPVPEGTEIAVRRDGSWVPVARVRGFNVGRTDASDRVIRLDGAGQVRVEIPGRKQAALFPGLEFLEGDEFSSSDRDARGPLADRRRPEPWKVTVPLMAFEVEGALVALMWREPRKAYFEARERNVMALEDAGPATVLVQDGGTILEAVPRWTAVHGLPEPEPWPRSREEELALCKAGLEAVAVPGGKHRPCAGKEWAPDWSPGFAVLLHLLGEKVDWNDYPDLLSTANCHILKWEAPFYAGEPETARKLRGRMEVLLALRGEDGEWGFHPMNDRQRALGKAGHAVLGTSAHNALSLAKAARMTGDAELKELALDVLRKLRRHKVPRGGQGWECPIEQPDLLAAAYAVGACVEAYGLSGDAAFLADAARWARAGLPFVYLWNVAGRKGMRYASIPAFGTTGFTHPWFGVPAQWNGLVYAYYLRKLAPLEKSFDWLRVAEGLTASGVHQQYADGPSKGCYPDALYDQCTRRAPPDLNPENLLVNILASMGKDPDPGFTLKK